MERKKYQLILIFLLLHFALTGHGVSNSASLLQNKEEIFTKEFLFDNPAFRTQISSGNSSSHFKKQVYRAYISGKMEGWRSAIDALENQKRDEPEFLPELINYQYGYVAWCLGTGKKSEARHYLSLLDKNLEKLKAYSGETTEFHAYSAAANGFKIELSLWRSPFFGPRSMEHGEKALAKDPLGFQANMEMGNIWKHMPAVFGGSDEKALEYFFKALEIIEKESVGVRENNWMYLNLLALVGQMQQEMGNREQAKKYFEQALQVEPDFIWVKEELLPSLDTN